MDATAATPPAPAAAPAADRPTDVTSSSSDQPHSVHTQHSHVESHSHHRSVVPSSSSSSPHPPSVEQLSSSLSAVSLSCQPLPASSLVDCTYELYGDHIVWLQLMQQRYHISSPSKAVRILLTYIHSLSAAVQQSVFTRLRCKHCGLRQNKQPTTFALYPHQRQWVGQWSEQWRVGAGEGKVMRIVLDYVQWGERRRGMRDVEVREMLEAMERDIFTVIRCQDPTCTLQHGAQPAEAPVVVDTTKTG